MVTDSIGNVIADGMPFGDALHEVRAETRGNPRICIALIDGPVDVSHPALRGASITAAATPPRYDDAATRHATQVASIIFGERDGPVPGIAPGCQGISLPVFSSAFSTEGPSCSPATLATAITTAVEAGAHIINVSAGEPASAGTVHPDLERALTLCRNRGTLVVAAAGDSSRARPQLPARHKTVLGVAVDVGSGSEWQACLLAPGRDILAASPGGGTIRVSGTSYATAVVSGFAALLLSLLADEDPATPRRVGQLLRTTSQPSSHPGGGRRIDAASAVRAAKRSSTEAALLSRFRMSASDRFGQVRVQLPDRSYFVPDLLYPIEPGRLGMWFVPASDKDGGSALLDGFLRREMRLADDDPVYALLSYLHPEECRYNVGMLPNTGKLQLGHRHVGAYLGGGRTTHALARSDRWQGAGPSAMQLNVDRHPANLHIVSLLGVAQATLNRNAQIVDMIVSAGARVPEDADDLTDSRTVDLTTTLQYYRDLIREADYLREKPWFTNCSTHKTVVLNVALNVPHNPRSFTEIFGTDGEQLWRDLKRRYEALEGRPLDPTDETSFTPLWALAGFDPAEIRPLSPDEYDDYHAAREDGGLATYRGRRPLHADGGLAWPLETLVDVLATFVDNYVPFERVGGLVVAGEILAMRHTLGQRAGLDSQAYLEAVTPVLARVLAAGLSTSATSTDDLLDWIEKNDPLFTRAQRESVLLTIERAMALAQTETAPATAMPPFAAGQATAAWLRQTLAPELERLRVLVAPPAARTGRFASPSVFHKIALGLHPTSPFVRIRTLCTVIDRGDSKETLVPQEDIGHAQPEQERADRPLVYALGEVGYEISSRSRRDALKQRMDGDGDPDDPGALLAHLDEKPYDAATVQWTLSLDGIPIYILEPMGPFAEQTYGELRRFLREQLEEGVERVSIAGPVMGYARHRSGLELPVVAPVLGGMYSWTTRALVANVIESARASDAADSGGSASDELEAAVSNFLGRVYHELRNVGREPHERAINFAATNAFEVERVYERAIRAEMELDTIEVVPNMLVPSGASCWDVKLVFFFPERPLEGGRRVFRFTVDVNDVVPATIGPMRSWAIR
jgi:hypothetical protein